MLGSIHLSRSESSFAPPGAPPQFDLTVEGLNEPQARSTMAFTQNLMLGYPGRPFATNALTLLDAPMQKSLAILVQALDHKSHNVIQSIKHIRTLFPGAGLREYKEFVDYANSCTFGGPFGQELLCSNEPNRPSWVIF